MPLPLSSQPHADLQYRYGTSDANMAYKASPHSTFREGDRWKIALASEPAAAGSEAALLGMEPETEFNTLNPHVK